MKTLVYVESTVSPAFQFVPFETYYQAETFAEKINSSENTLKARVLDSNFNFIEE